MYLFDSMVIIVIQPNNKEWIVNLDVPPLRKNPWTALVLPYEFGPDGISLCPQTVGRLERLVSAVRVDGYNIPAVVLAAGLPPAYWSDRDSCPHTMPFSDLMYSWLVAEKTFHFEQIHVSNDAHVWTSWSEINEAISMIERFELPRNILVVSTGNHVYPRLWLTCRILLAFKKGWHVRFCPTWKYRVGMTHELLGTVKYMPMSIASRLRKPQ